MIENVDNLSVEDAYPNATFAVSFCEEVLVPPNPKDGETSETSPWLRVVREAKLESKSIEESVQIIAYVVAGILEEQSAPRNLLSRVIREVQTPDFAKYVAGKLGAV